MPPLILCECFLRFTDKPSDSNSNDFGEADTDPRCGNETAKIFCSKT